MLSIRAYNNAEMKVRRNDADPKSINENPLGLLIVLNKKHEPDSSAFSYSSDSDSDDSNDRQIYLNSLNDDFSLAMSLDEKRYFEPCRRLDEKKSKRKNLYHRPRKSSVPESSRHHFWPSTGGSWSAIGRFFGKLKHRHEDRDDGSRRLSLQTNASSNDGEYESSDHGFKNSSFDDPTAFLRKVQAELLTGDSRKSGDVCHFKVVSKNADDSSQFTITTANGKQTSAIFKEYFSRLTCYDAIPHLSQVVAVDVNTPVVEIFNILCSHHRWAAVAWDTSSAFTLRTRKLCDLEWLVHLFWPFITDSPDRLHHPLVEFLASSRNDENIENAFDHGISAEYKLIDASRLFRHQRGNEVSESKHHASNNKRFLLPLINETTGDVIHILSANDLLRFLSKELCKFDLTSTLDNTPIGNVCDSNSSKSTQGKWLYSTCTLRDASSVLINRRSIFVPVIDPSNDKYETTISIADVVDILAKFGYATETVLSQRLDKLLLNKAQRDIPTYTKNAPLSKVLNAFASIDCNHGSWDSMLPVAAIVNDEGVFVDYLNAEEILASILRLDECSTSSELTKIDDDCSERTTSYERHDSGVGDVETLSDDTSADWTKRYHWSV